MLCLSSRTKRTKHTSRQMTLLCVIASMTVLAVGHAGAASYDINAQLGTTSGSGLTDQQLDSVDSLLESELLQQPKVRLVESESSVTFDARVTRLDTQYVVLLTATDWYGDSRSRQYKIDSFDEIDVAIKRLVEALIKDASVASTAERGVVFGREQRDPEVVKSITGFEMAFGGAWSMTDGIGTNKTMYALSFGHIWEVDRIFLELRGDLQWRTSTFSTAILTGTLGANYIWFDTGQIAFFSGAEVGLGYFNGFRSDPDTSRGGFVFGGDTGVLLLRHSDITLDVRLRGIFLAEKMNGELPAIGMVLMGLHF
jgi:hypothetical protein